MIQFNLLPDIKLEYVKTQRTKHFLTLLSLVVSVASIAVLLVAIVTVDVVQKKTLGDENNDISRYTVQLKGVPNLDKILTVQNQLSTLTSLHEQKPVTSRLFNYISEVTPSTASLNNLDINFAGAAGSTAAAPSTALSTGTATGNTLTIGGSAPTLAVVNTFTDTLKATVYTVAGSNTSPLGAFSDVVLSSFGQGKSGATFTITCNFDPTIFDTDDNVTLTVPPSADANQTNVFQGSN